MFLRRVQVVGRSFAAGALALTNIHTAGDYGTRPRRGPPAGLPGAILWRHAWGDGAHCPSAGRWRVLPQYGPPRRVQRPSILYIQDLDNLRWGKLARSRQPVTRYHNFTLGLGGILPNPPLGDSCVVNTEPSSGHVPRSICVWTNNGE